MGQPEQVVYVDNEPFLGRLREQDHFREMLRTVLASRDDDAPAFIVLVHGVGGIGKSQLTRRLRDIALYEAPFEGRFHVLRVDWEVVRQHTLALRVARDEIRPEEVLDALYQVALDQKWGRHFKAYHNALECRRKAEAEVARAMDQLTGESRYAALRDLGARGLAKLVRMVLPVVGQTGEDLAQGMLAAGIQAGAEAMAVLREQADDFLRARLKSDQYEMYRQPHERLAQALGQGLARVTRHKPLVLLLDTYEIVSAAVDPWLRQVIRTARSRVVWVIAGRENLASDQPRDRYVGYSAEFPDNLFIWDVRELAIDYVEAYLRDRTRDCIPTRTVTRDDAAAIHRATLGVPLALRQAADLLVQGVPLSAITEGAPDSAPREKIVRLMCERVLLHVERDAAGQADRRALYLLAMQPRPDAGVQSAVLRPAVGFFDLDVRLAELARRYSAVRWEGGTRLHDAMGAFVREYLLTTPARHGDTVKEITTRAAETLRARRDSLEGDRPTIAERVESKDWKQDTLDLVHWLFWSDEQAAWRELVLRFVEGLGYDPDLAWGLLEVAEGFRSALTHDGARCLKRLQAGRQSGEAHGEMLDELERLDRLGWLDEGGSSFVDERKSILLLWRGRWYMEMEQLTRSLSTLLAAEQALPPLARGLEEQLGKGFHKLSRRFLWPGGGPILVPSHEGLQAAQRAADLCPKNDLAWTRLGLARWALGYSKDALAAHKQATELAPQSAYSWNGLGWDYMALGRYQDAAEAFQRAIDLGAEFCNPWNGLGNLNRALGHYEQAIEFFRQAIKHSPGDPYPRSGLGHTYCDLRQYEQAIKSHQEAIELAPQYPSPWRGLGDVYRNLGRTEEAVEAYRKATQLDPGDGYSHAILGHLYELQGRLEDALHEYQESVKSRPGRGAGRSPLARVLRKLGREAEAAEHIAYALERLDDEPDYNKACILSVAGDADAALDHLARALEQRPSLRDWARRDPDLFSLHGAPRFEALVAGE